MPGNVKLERMTTHPGSDLRQLAIQHNSAVVDLQMQALAESTDIVWAWSSASSNSTQAIGRGSTDTAIATGAFRFIITGQAASEAKAAVTTGTAIGAQTVVADTWAVYSLDVASGGTITVTAGAGNATSAYTTEALAIAAVPARVTVKARLGFITVKTKAATNWVAATDALAGGATGNPASVTNYYPYDGAFAPTGTALNSNGVICCAGAALSNGAAAAGSGAAWTAGRNGVLIGTTLSMGSTTTNVASTAFTFNANGVCNIAKAAVAAGTALGALGTIPADKWGIIVVLINTAGTVTFISGPANYTTGYATEQQALGDLGNLFPTAGLCMLGYVTVKTKAATAWVAGTDGFAGGAAGNNASASNFYSVAGITLQPGITASPIASRGGSILTSANY